MSQRTSLLVAAVLAASATSPLLRGTAWAAVTPTLAQAAATPKPPAVTPAAPSSGTPAPGAEAAEPAPEVHYGEEGLPEPVKALRRKILAAAKTGDLDQLRPIIQQSGQSIELSGGDTDDPVATLKLLAGDSGGREILAIMEEVFEAGWVHVDVGTPQDSYVWPYFTRYPLNKLTPPQFVELFRLITAGDFQDMQDKGVYSFYRAGISPDGTWQFFEDGD